jgi:hypothetical protein
MFTFSWHKGLHKGVIVKAAEGITLYKFFYLHQHMIKIYMFMYVGGMEL